MNKSAIFSKCKKYRYVLYRIWNTKKPSVLFIMLNPSTADENYNDPTINRCMKFAESWGFGGIVVGNLFAYRATKPKDMKKAKDPIGFENNYYLKKLSKESGLTILAWGNDGSFLNRDKEVVCLVDNPKCLSKTKSGQPGHPLFLKGDLKPINFK